MKRNIVTLLLSLILLNGFSQDQKFVYNGRLTPSIKKEKLNEARYIEEIMPGFSRYFIVPYKESVVLYQQMSLIVDQQDIYGQHRDNYDEILDLVSINISVISNGKSVTIQNTGDVLTAEQKNILSNADLGTDIRMRIKYKFKYELSDAANKGKINEGEYVVTIVPETEAEYPGGFDKMSEYLTENFSKKFPGEKNAGKVLQIIVKFTINEQGKVVNAMMLRTSGEVQIDKLLLDAIGNMPPWKPAENVKGEKVKQDFSIPLGGGGC